MSVKNCRILLVEDNRDDAFLIEQYLSQATVAFSCKFTTVERLTAALHLLPFRIKANWNGGNLSPLNTRNATPF